MLALIFLFVSLASAQQIVPPKCCVARQFEAKMGETGGIMYNNNGHEVPTLLDSDNVMHYDYYNRTLVMEINTHNLDGSTSYTRLIQDFKVRRQYVITGGKCSLTRTPRYFREPCIPDSANYIGRTTVGYGTNSIMIDTWQYPDPDTNNDFLLAVTTENCVPVVEAISGVVGAPAELTFLITDFKPGMNNVGVFLLPDVCKNTNDVVEDEDQPVHIQRALKAMSVLI